MFLELTFLLEFNSFYSNICLNAFFNPTLLLSNFFRPKKSFTQIFLGPNIESSLILECGTPSPACFSSKKSIRKSLRFYFYEQNPFENRFVCISMLKNPFENPFVCISPVKIPSKIASFVFFQ